MKFRRHHVQRPKSRARGFEHYCPQLIAKQQTQDKRHTDSGKGKNQALAKFLEMFEETHPRHAFFFFVALVGGPGRLRRSALSAQQPAQHA